MKIESELAQARRFIQEAAIGYAQQRQAAGKARLPGQFVDKRGVVSEHRGLTALLIWRYIGIKFLNPNIDFEATIYRRLIDSAFECIITKNENMAEKIASQHDVRQEDLLDYIVELGESAHKRALVLSALDDRERVIEEIQFLTDRCQRVGENYLWSPSLLDAPREFEREPNIVVSSYVLLTIVDACRRNAIKSEELSKQCNLTLLGVVNALHDKSLARLRSELSPFSSAKIESLFSLTVCKYAQDQLSDTQSPEMSREIYKTIKRTFRELISESRKDPLTISNEIMHFFPVREKGGEKEKYVRLNSDIILLKSYRLILGENLEYLTFPIGRKLLNRVLAPVQTDDFRLDANGQRLTVYNLYHCLSQVEQLATRENRSGERRIKFGGVAQPIAKLLRYFRYAFLFRKVAAIYGALAFASALILGLAFVLGSSLFMAAALPIAIVLAMRFAISLIDEDARWEGIA